MKFNKKCKYKTKNLKLKEDIITLCQNHLLGHCTQAHAF